MALLANTFSSRESRVTKTILAVDLTDSTGMKEQQPEASWLTTYGWFFDMVANSVTRHKGRIVKFLGDGALAVFSEDSPADAINCAIEIQESIAEAQEQNRVLCDCSIGIAYGEVVEFDTPDKGKDYIGTVVDRAFRLCSAANARAVFADSDTISAAAMNRVRSRLGVNTAPRRSVAEYQGPTESVSAKGFSRPISYNEILWAPSRYGVRPEFVTRLSSQSVSTSSPPSSPAAPAAATPWMKGHVVSLNERFGFVKGPDGEDFWFNSQYLFRKAEPVKIGDLVWFIPADPLPEAKSRRATDVVALGATLDGELHKVTDRGFGFSRCLNDRGDQREIFIYLGDVAGWPVGTTIEFTVAENPRGIAGAKAAVINKGSNWLQAFGQMM